MTGVDPGVQMDWRAYAISFVLLTLFGTLLLFVILLFQAALPLFDPANVSTPMTPDLVINIAVSFATTTTWQPYAGETTMSYTTQMVGLAAQNFLAGAAGLAIGHRVHPRPRGPPCQLAWQLLGQCRARQPVGFGAISLRLA